METSLKTREYLSHKDTHFLTRQTTVSGENIGLSNLNLLYFYSSQKKFLYYSNEGCFFSKIL